MADLVVSVLGPPRVEVEDVPIRVDTRKAVAIVAYLAVTGKDLNRDSLAGLLWPEYPQPRARAALRRTLSTLKKALAGRWLAVEGELVGLDREGLLLDVDRFRGLVASCGKHGHTTDAGCPRCVEPLTEAVALHRGDFMAGFALRDSVEFDGWQLFQAEAFRRELAGTLERLVSALTDAGDLEAAVARARDWLRLDPLHEKAHQRLMVLLAWSGDRAGALRQYRECVGVLDRELGVAPLEETTELSHAIEDERLPAPSLRERGEVRATGGVRARREPARAYPLVGRSEEIGALLSAWRAAGPDGRFVLVEGEAGIGKTRLAEELLEAVRTEGAATVAVRCYEDGRDLAYGPIVEALRGALAFIDADRLPDRPLGEVGRLIPEVGDLRPELPTPPRLGDPGARARFLDAVSELLLSGLEGDPAGVLFLDDLHWADEATLDVLAHLVRRLTGRAACVVVTWREEQVPREHRLRRLLAEARRAGNGVSLRLSRLTPGDVATLVSAALGSSSDGLAARLYEETEGVPFFLVEYLQAVGEGGPPGADEEFSLPSGVRDLLHARLATVGETGQQVLTAAAIIGRSFDPETVRGASGRSEEETASALEELARLGLVVEAPGSAEAVYDFSHPKLRALLYEEAGLARRRLLHRRVAETLSGQARRDASVSSIVAHHYRMGGREEEAAGHLRRAGTHARDLYANAEALRHFEEALALGHPDQAGLHRDIGDLQVLRGEYGAALSSYEAAAALSTPGELPAIEHRLGGVHLRLGEWDLANARFEAALGSSGEAGGGLTARVLADQSLAAHRAGRAADARRLGRAALETAEEAEDPTALAQAHNIVGMLAKASGDLDRARDNLQRSLAIAEDLADLGARAAALNNLALVHRAAGDLSGALELTAKALELSAESGDRHREAALHNNLADLLHATDRSEDAMSHLKRAVSILAEIGEEAGEPHPEIWKLVDW